MWFQARNGHICPPTAVSEETTTPLSTSVATPVATTTPVTVTTAEDTSNSSVLATYYRESLGQRFISTLSTSPSSSSPSLLPPLSPHRLSS